MGFYLRKSFRAGPVRLNLSKSGLGFSGGVKGARVGLGPRGAYVHGGRHGLYYRKYMASGQARSQSEAEAHSCVVLLMVLAAVAVGSFLLVLLVLNPGIFVFGAAAVLGVVAFRSVAAARRRRRLGAYKAALDRAFVNAQTPPSSETVRALEKQRQHLPKGRVATKKIEDIEANVYQAVLDKILDDGFITREEAASIAAAEQVLGLRPAARLETKKEIFTAAYLEAIEDRRIARDELRKLKNLMAALAIPNQDVQHEIAIVREIIDTQSLRLPFDSIPKDRLPVPIQKSEDAFYQCPAKVLSRRKSRKSPSGYEHRVRREGTLILTNKRVFVTGNGTTTLWFRDITDVEVDIDEGFVEISKKLSGRRTILKTDAPIYLGRSIELLMNA
ncbi:MAG: DUF4236 domain-containing protein [Candidatus Hydrogenedentota bacterium]